MRLFIHLLKLGFFIAALALTACSDKDTPGEIPPEVPPEVPEVDPPVPDGPYEHDYDMDYDSEEYLKAYKGTAYKGPHRVPGTVEAEDFDEGAQNVAYYESDSKLADAGVQRFSRR